MKNLISSAIAQVNLLLKKFQVKQLLTVVWVVVLLLTTNLGIGNDNSILNKGTDKVVSPNDAQRPQTTKQWMNEAKEDVPLTDRVGQIAEDSAEAVKDFGKMYQDTAKRSARSLEEDTELGKGLLNRD
jgi:hypothetical protein